MFGRIGCQVPVDAHRREEISAQSAALLVHVKHNAYSYIHRHFTRAADLETFFCKEDYSAA